MQLVYPSLLAVNNTGFLQHRGFGLVPIYIPVKILYFHQVLEPKNTKQKKLCDCLSYAKKVLRCVNFSVRSIADKAKVDNSWENCVLRQ